MKKLFLPLTVVVFVVACGPRDVPQGGREGGGSGPSGFSAADKKVSFLVDQDGEKAETCTSPNDYKTLIIPQSDVDQITSGQVTAIIEPGNRNCYRVGSTVELKLSMDAAAEILGHAKVLKLEGLPASKLAKRQAEAFGITVSELKDLANSLIEEAKNRPTKPFNAEGMVSITYFRLDGLPEEEPPVQPEIAKTYFMTEGEVPATCPAGAKDWTSITARFGKDLSKKVVAVMGRGDKNCLRIGSQVEVKYKMEDGTTVNSEDLARVVAVEVASSQSVGYAHAQILDMTVEDMRSFYSQNLSHDTVSIVYFTKVSP